jgi:hypothetical protein
MAIIWKEIKGYTNFMVSNDGQVKNVKKNLIRKQRVSKNGYAIIDLTENGVKTTFYVHRLVAQAFIDNPNDFPQVNHIDENKLNNNVSNLEWCDASYNNNYGTKKERLSESLTGRTYTEEQRMAMSERISGELHWNFGNHWSEEIKEKNGKGQPTRKQIKCIETGEVYYSIKDAARKTGINHTSINYCVNGKQRTAGGFTWEVVD